jgi:glycosyltransferase involved in cell wall biosynthesis
MHILYVALDPLKSPRIKRFAHTLRKYGEVGFDVMIPKFRFVSRGGKISRLFLAVINYATVLMQILFVQADLFWVANCPDVLVFPLVLRRKRYVLDYRSPWAVEVEDEFGSGPWVRLTAFFEAFALRHAWIVTLTTSKLATRIKDFGKPFFVFPNYPLKAFGKMSCSGQEFKERWGYHRGDKIILFVGKLTRVEGADMLPSIMEDVLKKADVTFWIVGSGSLYPSLKQFEKRFQGKVKLFGWQPHKEIPSFISAADVCIAPRHKSPFSVFYNEEGVSKLSEYMFFEKPIIACGVAESNEYLLVEEEEMAGAILRAVDNMVRPSKRKTWEEYSEKRIREMFNLVESGGI